MSPTKVSRLLPFSRRSGFPSNTCFLRPTCVSPLNSISIVSAVFAKLTCVPNIHTDTQTTLRATFVAIHVGRVYALSAGDEVENVTPRTTILAKWQRRKVAITWCPGRLGVYVRYWSKVNRLSLLLARLMGQYCFARWHLSFVVFCNAAGGRAGRRARGRLGGRHCTAGQFGYVPSLEP